MIRKSIARFLLRLAGWTIDPNLPQEAQRCVMIAAPHTSNWDFWYMRLAFFVMDIPLRYTVKKVLTNFPMGLIFKPLGGIGIDRRPKSGQTTRRRYTEIMKEIFQKHDRIAMVVTPEGTRSYRDKWKTGFYYTALEANVPITFGYLDYGKKLAGVGGVIHPSGDIEADMRIITAFYNKITPKHPSLFSVDKRYL